MTNFVLLISLLSLPWLLINISLASNSDTLKHYIVYMGGSDRLVNVKEGDDQITESAYHQLLSSLINPREEGERINILHNYNHAFRGFSAMLTDHQASLLSDHSEVVSVFADKMLQLHTTRSWDFLQGKAGKQARWSLDKDISDDVIIGLIDTGIWPESPSFNDEGFGPIPSRWKGACMEGIDFKKSDCNRKLIGARYYNAPPFSSTGHSKFKDSPRDTVGHGTHTASIAAGTRVSNASYYGLARGTARGGSPNARVASYKACSPEGCSGATILKAIEDAVMDGVDIISISIGMSALFQSDYLNDPIAIGAFHAEQMGVMVICSAGNDGPEPYTVVNTAPWIITVAASSIDRDFESTISLGNGKTYKGSSINFSSKMSSKAYPLVYGQDVAAKFTPIVEARNCYPGSLDREKVAGKIVVCISDNPTLSRRIKKLVVEDAKAKGMILINEDEQGVPFDSGVFSYVEVGSSAGSEILKYLNSTKKPTAKILPTIEVSKKKPSPVVAYFSSRGPSQLTENILKPDLMAPGVAILGAMIPKSDEVGAVPTRMKPSDFAVKSGTSMACPHVAGAAAFIKSRRPKWTSSMVRSALMTTATVYNNMRELLTNNSNNPANVHETGAGEINPIKALNPGLVFKTTFQNYLEFLCFYGYSEKNIRSMSSVKFSCPKLPTEDLITNVNYPSISVASLDSRHMRVVERVATNVGPVKSTYVAKVRSPPGLVVKVEPERIVYGKGRNKALFRVSFDAKEARKGYNFGSITWSDARHSVRIAYTVNVQ